MPPHNLFALLVGLALLCVGIAPFSGSSSVFMHVIACITAAAIIVLAVVGYI